MLAFSDTPKDLNEYAQHCPLLGSFKLDGIRGFGFGIPSLYMASRSLKPLPSAYAQGLALPEYEGFDGELVIKPKELPEGETIYHATFSAVMTDDCQEPLDWWVFDYVPYRVNDPLLYEERRQKLKAVLELKPHPDIKILEQRLLETPADIAAMEQEALDKGYEGLIVRKPNSIYHYNRSSWKQGYLMKVVRTLTSEAEILDITEMMHNDNEATIDARGFTVRSSHKANLRGSGMFGAFICRDIHGLWGGNPFKVGLGEGIDHKTREEIFRDWPKHKGWIFTYSYKPYGTKFLPRQPKWKVWRDVRDM
jgi:DNA ligase-1